MNPLYWKREHRVALAIAIVIGAAVGIVVGYFAYAAEMGIATTSFINWLKGPFRYSNQRAFHVTHLLDLAALWWGLFGAGIGAGVAYVRHLTARRP